MKRWAPSAEEEALVGSDAAMLRELVSGLSRPIAAAISGYYLDAVPMGELARRERTTVDVVKKRLSRGRNFLRQRLGAPARSPVRRNRMIEVEVLDILMERQVLLLDRARVLSIFVDEQQARAMAIADAHLEPPRPPTFVFIADLVRTAGLAVEQIAISDLREMCFIAMVTLAGGKQVDARPSDVIPLAVTLEVPIMVDEAVMAKAGVALAAGAGERTYDRPGLNAMQAELRTKLGVFGDEQVRGYVESISHA